MAHIENTSMVVSPQVVVNTVRDAHEYYQGHRIDERYEAMALDLIRRYVSQEGLPRDAEPFFGATLYMVTRHPWSHPNPLTKTEFAAKLRMKESSLDWYTASIVEKLDFVVMHDRGHLPFFLDPEGTIMSVVNSIVKSSVGEEVVHSIVRGSVVAPHALADRIVDRLCSVVKIIPSAFEQELHVVVERKIEEVSSQLLNELNRE
ncbi:MAG: hypothetical protein BAJATHORv1_50008 [Candidatus Thorarchaeota archaeon]|nr:MAG: hypothetical protein BAJATHORv1_50008 [Candidatus Thorarchaeota archaeon]